jgi:hypothetical protein
VLNQCCLNQWNHRNDYCLLISYLYKYLYIHIYTTVKDGKRKFVIHACNMNCGHIKQKLHFNITYYDYFIYNTINTRRLYESRNKYIFHTLQFIKMIQQIPILLPASSSRRFIPFTSFDGSQHEWHRAPIDIVAVNEIRWKESKSMNAVQSTMERTVMVHFMQDYQDFLVFAMLC